MADLLVHVASGFAVGRPLRDGRLRSLIYVGVCLPDLLYKGLLYLGGAPTWLCEPTHSPLGLVVFCYAAALLFEEDWICQYNAAQFRITFAFTSSQAINCRNKIT